MRVFLVSKVGVCGLRIPRACGVQDKISRVIWVAMKELNLSYYFGKPYYLQYIPINYGDLF